MTYTDDIDLRIAEYRSAHPTDPYHEYSRYEDYAFVDALDDFGYLADREPEVIFFAVNDAGEEIEV